ncbi:Uncharacterised protein [Mycobacteroides abscessus subsp. abscessus]|uniref:hypothetical protein n=1 Tax=Mycobacteroides abscessus TaxID=36809 RepID=UPI00092892EC|nr:hypothetical protein [Mycobacteroides abscessus]MDO3312378.1 hypothetical protein [Mycobacteroides abscessus subsp. abscessus]MDO3344940.1 hypothetical protein [Mycobacteroides abscessus subsp. abscessus]SHP09833.1 Uncharacterised protein [Mycobacteroides abscessus subsp. abscessus]SHP23792.1 Uncharacterised protein [Mycobacteroides abscessus subsp. abscessus]SHP94686.1 Uncharacterised protein [Mycobacteroides abscessus subsp. abscessus]
MTEPEQHIQKVLVRYMSDALNEVGGALIPDVFRRPAIELRVRTRGTIDQSTVTMPGIELAGGPDMEPLARNVGKLILKIMSTDEVLWVAVNARSDFGGWNIECVPLVEHMKLSTPTDEQVLKASGIDPETGKPR